MHVLLAVQTESVDISIGDIVTQGVTHFLILLHMTCHWMSKCYQGDFLKWNFNFTIMTFFWQFQQFPLRVSQSVDIWICFSICQTQSYILISSLFLVLHFTGQYSTNLIAIPIKFVIFHNLVFRTIFLFVNSGLCMYNIDSLYLFVRLFGLKMIWGSLSITLFWRTIKKVVGLSFCLTS